MRIDYDELLHADSSALRRLAVFAGLVSADVASDEHPAVRELRELWYL
jgi:hypothetical protein